MCGIAGVYNRNGAPAEADRVAAMLARIAHRGPDDSGIELLGPVGLGHRRLSIIDVTSAGHQPMPTADRGCWITYNGEIYNYREVRRTLEARGRHFRSDSDTEVILQAYEEWGARCLDHFNGMFAFAIWDTRKRALFCARDRIGIKPFYFIDDPRRFAFASEIKALLALPDVSAAPDMIGMLDFLAFTYVRGARTLFESVRKLLPGQLLWADERGTRIETYWDVEFDESDRRDEAAIVEELSWLVDDAVRIQLRADVPVGTHLSGGLDSSLVTALARKHHPGQLLSFSGRFAEGAAYDESRYAAIAAQAAGVERVDVLIDASDFVEHLRRLTWHMDEPTAGPGLYPQFFVCQAARRRVTVALGGQGGDEIFVGYPRYRDDLSRHQTVSLLRGRGRGNGFPARTAILNVIRSGGFRSIASLLLRRTDPIPARNATARLLTQTARAMALDIAPGTLEEAVAAEPNGKIPEERSLLGRLLYYDLKNYLPALLHVEDRTSMAVSLESRVPLLDHRIVEMAARVPTEVKFPPFRFKHLLRKVAEPILPAEIVNRPDKMGFPTPLGLWLERLRGDGGVQELLQGTTLRRLGLLRKNPLQDTRGHAQGSWSILSLELWSRVFLEREPVQPVTPELRSAS